VDWERWAPTYRAILADFGYSERDDEAARDLLAKLLEPRLRVDLAALRARLAGREAWIVGAAAAAEDVLAIPQGAPLLVTDGAAGVALPLRRADAIVTDLDGDVGAQAIANALGVPLFVHAHGDNAGALREHVPRFVGPVAGTTQAAPVPRVADFGGFTDGDRACCLAAHLGAASLVLVGFDFDAPVPKPGRDASVKARKLAWARRIIDGLGVPTRAA
jgi:2-amino-4-hydroxy-6-hydroxymethyldihydropteridine diphosphokinase